MTRKEPGIRSNLSQFGSALTVLLVAVSLVRAESERRPDRPHVVVILADDLGWGDIGCHGGPTPTPHMDRLFAESVQLTSFLVTPLCSPTRAALMTGRHPARTGLAPFVVNPKTPATIQPEEVTLGEAFRAAGYATACFGKWHLGFVHSTRSHGFDEFVGCMAGGVDYFKRTRPTNPNELDWQRNGEPCEEEGYTTDLIRDRAVRYIRAADPGRPFFLYVPFTAIHTPLQVTNEYLDRVPAAITDETRRTYSAMTIALDDAVGALMEALDQRDLARDTIVFFASDNGATPDGSNLPFRGGKHTPYEGGLRSTAAVRWPGRLPVGHRVDDMLAAEDAYPTLLALAGVRRPDGPPLDGRDFSPLLRAETAAASGPVRDVQYWIWLDSDVIRTPRWKLIRQAKSRELYDIQADPAESSNVASRHPELVAELEMKLDAWERSVPVFPMHRPVPLTVPARPEPSGDVLEIRVRRAGAEREADSSLPIVLAAKRFVLAPGDRLEYDMYVAPDSPDAGFFVQIQTGLQDRALDEWRSAVDQYGNLQAASVGFPQARGRWARRVIGLGSKAPTDCGAARIMFYGREPAEYRLYVDNIVVRRADGTTIDLYRDGEYKRRNRPTGAYPQISIKSVSATKVPAS